MDGGKNTEGLKQGSERGREGNAPRHLLAMRYVLDNDPKPGDPKRVREMHDWLSADRKEFVRELHRMELSWRRGCRRRRSGLEWGAGVAVPGGDVAAAGGTDTAGQAPKFDPKTEWLLALIRECQGRLGGGGGWQMVALVCRSCGIRVATRPRRLCAGCYDDLERRGMFPVGPDERTAKYARRGLSDAEAEVLLPRKRKRSQADIVGAEMRAVDDEIEKRLRGDSPLLN